MLLSFLNQKYFVMRNKFIGMHQENINLRSTSSHSYYNTSHTQSKEVFIKKGYDLEIYE